MCGFWVRCGGGCGCGNGNGNGNGCVWIVLQIKSWGGIGS